VFPLRVERRADRSLLLWFLLRVSRELCVHSRVDDVVRAIFVLLVGAVGRGRWSRRWRRSCLAASGAAHGKGGGKARGGTTVEVVRRLGFVWEEIRQPRGAACVAAPLTSLAEVGDGHSAGKALPLTWRRLSKRRLIANISATEKTHRARIAARRAR
jgi:hypothetical protein